MKKLLPVVIVAVMSLAGCSSVYKRMLAPGFSSKGKQGIKRIVITTNQGNSRVPGLASLISLMSRDLLRTNRNYLIYDIVPDREKALESCSQHEGFLEFNINKSHKIKDKAELDITGKLVRCLDKKVVWSASAKRTEVSDNSSLENVVGSYVEAYGKTARIYAAPAFNVMEDLIEVIPNPDLTEDEVMEKINLEISRAGSEEDSLLSAILPR